MRSRLITAPFGFQFPIRFSLFKFAVQLMLKFTSHLVKALILDFFEHFKKLFIKIYYYYIKVSSGTSLRPSIRPDSGFSPLPLRPCDFSFAAKARPCDSNSRNLVDL